MKLLLFSDLHADIAAAKELLRRSESFDVLIGAGDFGNMRRQVRDCITVLRTCDKPTILVAGNNESVAELREACHDWPAAIVLHGTSTTVQGVTFFGVGGGIPVTPFGNWSYDFSEVQATEWLKDMPTGGVLVTHSPPKGAVDIASNGKSLGSTAIRDAIVRTQPVFAVCGHIHASAGKCEMIGSTSVINAGPNGIEWEIPS